MPGAAASDSSGSGRASRWWTGSTLLLGGALSLIACFLPFARITWPAIAGEPPEISTLIPAQPLLTPGDPTPITIVSAVCGALLLLGAPVGMAALGVGALGARGWAVGWRGFSAGFPLVTLGVAYTLINAAFALTPTSPNFPGITRTLEGGAALMALGNLLALVGITLLPRIRPAPAAERRQN
jgi:hypothetical protein